MRILHAEAGEQNFGIASDFVSPFFELVKEKIRRLRDEDSAVAQAHAGRQVQAGDDILRLAKAAIFIGIGEDADTIRAFGAFRRRLGDAVINGAQVLIDLDRLEAGRVRILQILNDPDAAAVVKGHGHRLADRRLRGDQANAKTVGHFHVLRGFFRRHGRLGLGKRDPTDQDQENGTKSGADRQGYAHRQVLRAAGELREAGENFNRAPG